MALSGFGDLAQTTSKTWKSKILGQRLALNQKRLLFDNLAQVRSRVEFDLCRVCAVRHHDGRIAYAASAKLHFLFYPDFAILDKDQRG